MIEVIRHFQLRDHHQVFSHQGEGINPVVYFKCFGLAFVRVHEMSSANQYFVVHFSVGQGYVQRVLSVRL